MILNAYDYVKDLIEKGKYSILENELDRHPYGKVIVEILKADYSAKYNPSDDKRFCGSWSFENPTLEKRKYKALNDFSKESHEITTLWIIEDNEKFSFEYFAEEIARLEHNGKLKDYVLKELLNKQAYIGKDRIWFVSEEYHY